MEKKFLEIYGTTDVTVEGAALKVEKHLIFQGIILREILQDLLILEMK